MTAPTPRLSVRIRVQITLITVVVGATLLATWQFGTSSGAYQDAMRQDVRRQAAMVEDIRAVYADEAPRAFRVAVAQARAEGLRDIKDTGRLAASEYTLAAQTAFHTARAAPPDSLLGKPEYHNRDLGYDLPRRLADLQKMSPQLYGLDPEARAREGDRWATWGTASAAVGIGAVLVAVCAANVLRPRRWRAPVPSGRRVLRRLEIIPQPATASADHYRGTLFHLLVFVLPLLLPLGQILAASSEQHAQAQAARGAVQMSTSIEGHGLRSAFLNEGVQASLEAEFKATARQLSAGDTRRSARDAEHESAVAAAESRIAARVRNIAGYMGRPPTAEDRVDAATVAALIKEPKGHSSALAEQKRQVNLAERAGRSSLLLSAATAVAVVAEILALAALAVRNRRWLWMPGLGVLASAVLTFVSFV